MNFDRYRWVGYATIALLVAGCAGGEAEAPAALVAAPEQQAQVQPPIPAEPVVEQAPPSSDVPPPVVDAEVEAVQPQTEIVEPAVIEPAPVIAGRPSAPAPIDGGFRADPASVFAATGNPQLIEFFTYW